MSRSSGRRSSTAACTPAASATPTATALVSGGVDGTGGFDVLRTLFYVATRKSPGVALGPVDLSCAFVVCDLALPDNPIIHASDAFQTLTGYARREVLGKNPRFLQSPDGLVDPGSRREYVAPDAVGKLKRAVVDRSEAQIALLNYRRGGTPFVNLLTLIPVPWDSADQQPRYCLGFMLDLVDNPDAIAP
ncbi:hypothetical protein C8A05DRAFT_20648, partial [Staphylotrichum tortipilum]